MQQEIPPEEAPIPADQPAAAEPAPQPPGRFQQFLKRALRWLALVLVFFIAGMLTNYFVFQKPKVEDLNRRLVEASGTILSLNERITEQDGLLAGLPALEEENASIKDSLQQAELHVLLLAARADVHAAQYALALEKPEDAGIQLSRTAGTLTALQALLPADQQASVDTMLQRLDLALTGMTADQFAAQSDLDVLSNSLIQLENALFPAP
jgi:hypothetical protein